MALFNSPEEQARKASLKKLEDKRVAFAAKLADQGFAPEDMLFAQNENGGFTAISRFKGQYWVIVSPDFGTDEEFMTEASDELNYRVEEVFQKAEGMGGMFGFGKKAEVGVEYIITLRDGSEAKMSFVSGRSGWLRSGLKKNPLLSTKRRRGDANVAWDFHPMERSEVDAALRAAADFFPTRKA